jgi:predicted flap endonuclease-1-like 5' DNA nuclease
MIQFIISVKNISRSKKMAKLIDVEGIGEVYAQKLIAVGIETSEGFLEKGATAKGRQEIAEKSGISEKLILRWANNLDLFRIKGIGSEYADLLEASGVDTVPELAQRKAHNLHEKIVAINEEKKLVRALPGESQVSDWIEEAKQLPRILTY